MRLRDQKAVQAASFSPQSANQWKRPSLKLGVGDVDFLSVDEGRLRNGPNLSGHLDGGKS
ncbi:MAG: hypothetical protein HS120_10970 [Burkholderiales bacterium]|nr:hypothetical protein [Burkholderiales bacterium]